MVQIKIERWCDLILKNKHFQPFLSHFPESYTPATYRAKGACIKLIIFIMLVFLSNCSDPFEVAMNTTDYWQGKAAVEELSDPAQLKAIAFKARRSGVRAAAIKKLNDPILLEKIAFEDHDSGCRSAAVSKLTDSALLAMIALESYHGDTSDDAVAKLTDIALLAKIAMDARTILGRRAAIEKLTVLSLGQNAGAAKENTRVKSFNTLIHALKTTVPKEHHTRIMIDVLPAIGVLNEPEVIEMFGEIASIRTAWAPKSASYYGAVEKSVSGEEFACSIKLMNLSESLSHLWTTVFPATKDFGFPGASDHQGARIEPEDLLEPLVKQLPQDYLAKLAMKSRDIGEIIIEMLTNQTLLAKVAMDAKIDIIREAAVDKVTDPGLLTKVALEAEDNNVRKAAVEKIPDNQQSILERIALKDKVTIVRKAAVKKLTDQTLLAEIAATDEDQFVCKAIVEKLTDQTLIVKVAMDAKDLYIREAAVDKLTDPSLLKKVALEAEDNDVRIAAVEKIPDDQQLILERIALKDKAKIVREAAVKKLTDQTLLTKIASDDESPLVREAAKEREEKLR